MQNVIDQFFEYKEETNMHNNNNIPLFIDDSLEDTDTGSSVTDTTESESVTSESLSASSSKSMDHDIPNCTQCFCIKIPSAMIAIAIFEIITGTIIDPIFLCLYYVGNVPSEYLGIYDLPNANLIYTLVIAKCFLLIIGGILAIMAVMKESINLTKIFYVWIGLRILFQIILIFLYQYNAMVEILLWIWLAYEFGHYISYLRRKKIKHNIDIEVNNNHNRLDHTFLNNEQHIVDIEEEEIEEEEEVELQIMN